MSYTSWSEKWGVPTWRDLLKYVLEGVAVSIAAYFLSSRSRKDLQSVVILGLTAALVFYILDMFAPLVVGSTRQGAGFGVGFGLVGGAKKKKHDSKKSEDDEHSETSEEESSGDSEEETEETFTDEEGYLSETHEAAVPEGFEAAEGFGGDNGFGLVGNEGFSGCSGKMSENFGGYPLNLNTE